MIFVSYAREDLDSARRFTDALRKLGLRYWWDERGIRAGSDWNEDIDQAARDCFAACVLVSDAALDSDFIWGEEIPRLRAYDKSITFVLVEELWSEDVHGYVAGLAEGDLRKMMAAQQWARDPAEGPLPSDDAEYRQAMRAVHKKLLELVSQGRAEQERKRDLARFTRVGRAEFLVRGRSGDQFGIVAEGGEGFILLDPAGNPGPMGELRSRGRIDRVVISPQGDLVVVQTANTRPAPGGVRGPEGLSVIFWGLGTGGGQFSCLLPSAGTHVLSCWMASGGVQLQVILSEGTSVEQWSVNPLRGIATCVDRWTAMGCVSGMQVEIDGEISRLWVEADGLLRESGPANLASGFLLRPEEAKGWACVNLVLHGSHVMTGGIRDGMVHVCLGTVTAGGSLVWDARKVVTAMSEFRMKPTSIALGRAVDADVDLGRFLVSDHFESLALSLDDL